MSLMRQPPRLMVVETVDLLGRLGVRACSDTCVRKTNQCLDVWFRGFVKTGRKVVCKDAYVKAVCRAAEITPCAVALSFYH